MSIPLIVGAGPTGLAAAVFLKKAGKNVRIIDSLPAASPYSKALAINPRTLELLETVGVTEKLLAAGKRINEMNMYLSDKEPVRISMNYLHHKYNFMLALSQASTEEILTEELYKLGGHIERGIKLNNLHEIENVSSGVKEEINPEWILGADGAHSKTREEIGAEFHGSSLDNIWYLADVALETELAEDRAYAFLVELGFIFMIPVIRRGEASHPTLWRVISNFPEPLKHLVKAKPVSEPEWESSFHIGHRLASVFSKDNVYLAGDAAHIHSPLGARGMNLGIEDAYVFAKLLQAGRLDKYAGLRRKVDAAVVKKIRVLTNIINSNSWFYHKLRQVMLPIMANTPFLAEKFIKTGAGLDHPVI